ncbi:ubiquitin-like-specific protease 1C isoform X2 [Macadamia integrifolia]|uniref:ubiquitin-like-specific protease 1C isoform X2 n=1 Tax=Macadamia integrifolia TaxID=60698 RepID=UPI001C4FB369|nr:ubiquitin-like-specific protease 1C isoform X2 [Macadamia integrifolia]
MEGGKAGKKPLVIDWNAVLDHDDDDDDPVELDVVRDEQSSQSEDLQTILDHNLHETICRLAKEINVLSSKLPDKGAKLRARIQRLEHEENRRRLSRLQADEDCRNVTHSGACNGSSSVFQSFQAPSKSVFIEILETKSDTSIHVGGDAFAKEFSHLRSGDRQDARPNGRLIHEENQSCLVSSRELPFKFLNSDCQDKDRQRLPNGGNRKGTAPSSHNCQDVRQNGHLIHGENQSRLVSSRGPFRFLNSDCQDKDRQRLPNCGDQKGTAPSSGNCQDAGQKGCFRHGENQSRLVSSRESPFKFLNGDCQDKNRQGLPNGGDQKGTAPSSLDHQEENLSGCFSKKRKFFLLRNSLDSRTRKTPLKHGQSHQTVVLVDEEDCPSVETTLQKDQPIGWKKDTKIYYPSRYLRRPRSPTGRPRGDYHFFNTYFYEKLKEAVSYKKNEKDAFVKFRRWWKGVNIFQKAYILLPIHEKQHWSLVIICNPDKDEESEQIILLHLDSLGCHASSEIFENIRRFLMKEWKYLSEEVAPPDIGDRERSYLQDKISGQRIMVPQQKNAYDCGIFVLYFMERFIKEAPEGRIKERNPAMFGKQWFKPEEASGLRGRIRELLIEEFENAEMEDLSRESSPVSSDDAPVGDTEYHYEIID